MTMLHENMRDRFLHKTLTLNISIILLYLQHVPDYFHVA